MPPSDTYSATAVDGSADESAATKSPTELEADAALGTQRIATFMTDTSLAPPVASSYSGYYDHRNTAASRCRVAKENIAAVDEAFAGNGEDNNNDNEDQEESEKGK